MNCEDSVKKQKVSVKKNLAMLMSYLWFITYVDTHLIQTLGRQTRKKFPPG